MIELYLSPEQEKESIDLVVKKELIGRIEALIASYEEDIEDIRENMPHYEKWGSERKHKNDLALKVEFVRKLKRVLDPGGDDE